MVSTDDGVNFECEWEAEENEGANSYKDTHTHPFIELEESKKCLI